MEESAYEKQREKLVEENKRRLEELFGKDDIALVPANPKKKQKRAKKEKDVDINTERRKSNRIAGNPVEHKRLKHQGDFSDDDEGIVREVGENDSDFVASDDEIAVVPATGPRRKPANIGKRQRTGKQVVVKKGGRVYDSVNGTSCHQCRQKTLDAKVQCTNVLEFKDENGNIEKIQCPLKLDALCLGGRYGEDLETVIKKGDWICPKCRGICNCSFCMSKRGAKPTGQLKNYALQKGFNGVSQYLQAIGTIRKPFRPLVVNNDDDTPSSIPTE